MELFSWLSGSDDYSCVNDESEIQMVNCDGTPAIPISGNTIDQKGQIMGHCDDTFLNDICDSTSDVSSFDDSFCSFDDTSSSFNDDW